MNMPFPLSPDNILDYELFYFLPITNRQSLSIVPVFNYVLKFGNKLLALKETCKRAQANYCCKKTSIHRSGIQIRLLHTYQSEHDAK